MLDCVVLPSGPGALRIGSTTLFADLNNPHTKAFLACLLEADPAAEISIHGAAVAGRQVVAEIRHSQPTTGQFLSAVVNCMRNLAGVSPKTATKEVGSDVQAESQTRVKKAKVSAKALVSAGVGSRNGNVLHDVLGHDDSDSSHFVARGSVSNNGANYGSANGNGSGHHGTVPSKPNRSVSERPKIMLGDIRLMPDRKGITRIGRNGTHATAWEVVHETPGRLRLKHPALYRRKEV